MLKVIINILVSSSCWDPQLLWIQGLLVHMERNSCIHWLWLSTGSKSSPDIPDRKHKSDCIHVCHHWSIHGILAGRTQTNRYETKLTALWTAYFWKTVHISQQYAFNFCRSMLIYVHHILHYNHQTKSLVLWVVYLPPAFRRMQEGNDFTDVCASTRWGTPASGPRSLLGYPNLWSQVPSVGGYPWTPSHDKGTPLSRRE